MFEDSLVESRIAVLSAEKRWTAVASAAVQVSLAAVVIALPLLHPEALPFHMDAPKVLMPVIPKPLASGGDGAGTFGFYIEFCATG